MLEGCWLLFAGTAEEGNEGGALREADFVVQVRCAAALHTTWLLTS